jgi:hypothetical protein
MNIAVRSLPPRIADLGRHHKGGTVDGPRRLRSSGPLPRLGAVLVAVLLTVGLVGACGTSTKPVTSTPAASGGGNTATVTGEATPGTCPTSNTKSFAKTKFVLHAGLAFGAFHRYLYDPFKAGAFSAGAHGRILTFVKAGAAAIFIEHEIRLTAGDVQANPTLCKVLASPLRSLSSDVSGAVSGLRGGNTSAITGGQSNLGSITSLAKSHGASIVDQAAPSL